MNDSNPELDQIDASVTKAVNEGDRKTLLALEGQSALIGLSFARGDYYVIKACASRFEETASRVWRSWLRYVDQNGLDSFYVISVAEKILVDLESVSNLVVVLHKDSGLNSSQRLALDLEPLYDSVRWSEWDAALFRARTTLPWDPRLAIAEIRGQRVRSRATAWRLVQNAFDRYPDHFTLGQMFAGELSWAFESGLVTTEELPELWAPVERLLDVDPYDLRLLEAREFLFPLSVEDLSRTDEACPLASEIRDKLIREILATPV